MFEEAQPFIGFSRGSQEKLVPPLLLALISMILDGSSIKDQMTNTTTATVTIAQMLKFNNVKHKRKQSTPASSTVRHRPAQEMPVPIYIGLMLEEGTGGQAITTWYQHFICTCSLPHSPDGEHRLPAVLPGAGGMSTKDACGSFHYTVQYYTDVTSVTSSIKNVSLPAGRVTLLARDIKQHKEEEYM